MTLKAGSALGTVVMVTQGADSPSSRHLPPIPVAWLVLFDMLLIGVASAAASIVSRIYVGGTPASEDVLPAGPRGEWVAWTAALCLLLPLTLLVLDQYRVAKDVRNAWSFTRVLAAHVFAFGGLWLFLYFQGQPIRNSDARVVAHLGISLFLLAGWRGWATYRLRQQVVAGKRVRNVLLVGEDPSLTVLAKSLVMDPYLGRRVVGVVRASPLPALDSVPDGTWEPGAVVELASAVAQNTSQHPRHLWAAVPVRGDQDRERIIDSLGAEEVMLSNRLADADLMAWLRLAQVRGIDTHIAPYSHDRLGIQPQAWMLGDRIMLDVHRHPMNPLGWAAKRTMDVVGAIVGLILGSPLMLAAAIAIKLEDPKLTVMYPGRRVGLKGRVFRMQKFTTMRANAQELEAQIDLQAKNKREGPWFKLEADNDPRLTKSGKWIRKLTINEIPQFWNVLKGDMSLVGPRPPTPGEVATYLGYDFRYFQVLNAKPGMTGLWQVTARNDPSFDRRLALDLEYMQKWSIWLDVRILLKTVGTVLTTGE